MLNKKIMTFALLLFTGLPLLFPVVSRANESKLVIGLIPEMNIFKQKQRFIHLGLYLTKKTGVPIVFTILSRYGNLIDRFEKDKMDGAFFGSFTGAAAVHKLHVVPVARPVNLDNTSTYQGYIFARKDSGIRDVKAMKGKTIAFVEKATTAGYLFPLAYLRENGISSPDGFFRKYYFTGSHDAAINAVLEKKTDIGAAKHSIYDRMSKEDPRVSKELVIIARSPSVPSNGLCVRRDLSESLRNKLKNALVSMHNDPEGQSVLQKFGALGFIETTEKDYDPVHDLARKAGIDLIKYNWQIR